MEFLKKILPAKYSARARLVLTYNEALLNIRDTNKMSCKTLHLNNKFEPAFENYP